MAGTHTEFRYQKLSWPQINEAVEDERMIVIPVGSTEDHGPHLPLDVDQVIPETICEKTVRDRDDALLFQTVRHGFLPHHMDFPGGTTVKWDRFVEYVLDICLSLAHHGFSKILLVNGHGSNDHLLQQVARQVIVQYPTVQCSTLSWWHIEEFRAAFREHAEAGPRGSAHAGEMETSVYLAIDPHAVDMDEAERDISYPMGQHFYAYGLADDPDDVSTNVSLMEWWSTISRTGVKGDPTVATAEKGEAFLAAAVAGLHSILDEFVTFPMRPIDDHHAREIEDEAYDPFRPR